MTAAPAVLVDKVSIRYGSFQAVTDVTFEVAPGEIVGLIGPNGSGKTSLVESVGGLRNARSGGSICVFGLDPIKDHRRLAPMVGMQLQESLFPSRARVGELCRVYEAIYNAPGATRKLLETFSLADRQKSYISSLSGGMRQRLALALAQVGDVRLVILDELTTGLDPEQRRETWRAVLDLAERGVAVLLTSHYMDEVEALCNRVFVLKSGQLIAQGTPAQIATRHGGSSVFTINIHPTDPIVLKLDELGLGSAKATGSGQVEYSGVFPTDFDRIARVLAGAGRAPSLVQHRAPSFEDAYLRIIQADADAGEK